MGPWSIKPRKTKVSDPGVAGYKGGVQVLSPWEEGEDKDSLKQLQKMGRRARVCEAHRTVVCRVRSFWKSPKALLGLDSAVKGL